MTQQYLYEFKCKDDDCNEYFLAKNGSDLCCPYCGDTNFDYAPGEIFPVIEYTPGVRKVVVDF